MESEIALALLQVIGLILPVTLLTARLFLNHSNSPELNQKGNRVFTTDRKIVTWLVGSVAFLTVAASLSIAQLIHEVWGTNYTSVALVFTMVAFLSFLVPIYWLRDQFEIPVAG